MLSFLADSGQGVVKLDVQPKCVAVGPGGYAVVVCIGQVGARRCGRKARAVAWHACQPGQ